MFSIQTERGNHWVKICGAKAQAVVASPVFQSWLKKFDHERLELRRVNIQSADIFGERVVFVKMKCDVVNRETKKPVPGIVFLRGDAVTILLFVVCKETGDVYVVTTKQVRVPLGNADFIELPAGMMDKDDNLVSRAVAEIEEETGLRVKSKMLRHLGYFSPSAGGCDEEITCYTATVSVSKRKMKTLAIKLHGVEAENEEIAIQFRTVREFLEDMRDSLITDGKAFAAVMMFLLGNRELLEQTGRRIAHMVRG